MPPKEQGRLFAQLRNSYGFSLEAVAQSIGLSPEALDRLEQGWVVPKGYYRRLAWSLGQEYWALLCGRTLTEDPARHGLRQSHPNPQDWCALSIWFWALDWFAQHTAPRLRPTPICLPITAEALVYHHRHYGEVWMHPNPQGPFQGKAAWLPAACEEEVLLRLKAGVLSPPMAREILLLD